MLVCRRMKPQSYKLFSLGVHKITHYHDRGPTNKQALRLRNSKWLLKGGLKSTKSQSHSRDCYDDYDDDDDDDDDAVHVGAPPGWLPQQPLSPHLLLREEPWPIAGANKVTSKVRKGRKTSLSCRGLSKSLPGAGARIQQRSCCCCCCCCPLLLLLLCGYYCMEHNSQDKHTQPALP